MLDPKSGQLHYLNPSAALVFALIGEVGYERALEELRSTHAHVSTLTGDVERVVGDLRERGLLVDA